MTPFSDRHKQLLFDYSLGLTSEYETTEAERLIASSHEATALLRVFQDSLAPLDSLEVEPCPEELTDRLFERVAELSQVETGRNRLESLLAGEQERARTIKIPLWRNWSEVVVAAAAVLLVVSVLFPTVGSMRQKYWQAACRAQLSSIYDGLRNYMSDHDGLLPAVAMIPGAPWWKVGYQGEENHSNTRRPWLLVRGRYVEPQEFLCPGRRERHPVSFKGIPIQSFNDFPSRAYIHLSVRIGCPTSSERGLTHKCVIMADRNPLSEELPAEPPTNSASLCLQLCERVMTSNSRNHAYRGQNALLYDGSVEFARKRHTSISEDDIYSLRDMSPYSQFRGCELPSCDADIFLAP
jgi:hypothetical protein